MAGPKFSMAVFGYWRLLVPRSFRGWWNTMSDDFEFEEGDSVLIRIREHGDSGHLRAKVIAECVGFRESEYPGSDFAKFEPPWDRIADLALKPYDAEFEYVEDVGEVNF